MIIERAGRNGKTQVQIIRFPSDLCSDHGRAINQRELGWESTLRRQKSSMKPGLNTSSRVDINCSGNLRFYRRQARRRRYDVELELSQFVHSLVSGAIHTAVGWS